MPVLDSLRLLNWRELWMLFAIMLFAYLSLQIGKALARQSR